MENSRLWLIASAVAAGTTAFCLWRGDKNWIQRNFWDVIYDRGACLYDSVDWFTFNTTHRLRRKALYYLPKSARVLEVGMGTGSLHVDLATAGYPTSGLDLAPGMVRLTQQRMAAKGLSCDVKIGNVTAIPWENDTFDAVLTTFCLSAVADINKAIEEMIRVLKPGGRLIIVDAGPAQNGNTMASLLAWCWSALGDFIRDEACLLAENDDIKTVTRQDYGPWDCVHITVGEKKS